MPDTALDPVFRLFDHLSDGFCLADSRGNAIYVNDAARRLLELPQGEAELNMCRLLCEHLAVEGGEHAGATCPLRDGSHPASSVTFLGRHGPHSAFNWRGESIQRAERWTDLRVRCLRARLPLDGHEGEELHVIILEDASSEMDLRRHRADWRSMVAHDLRTPLTGIFGALRLLAEMHPEVKDGQSQDAKLVQLGLRNCERMIELLDLYLDVARIDAGAMPVRPEPLALLALAQDAVSEQSATAAAHDVTVELAIPPDLKAVADKSLLSRVFENIVNNGIKYNNPGGRLTISARAEPAGVEVSFADTGRGIEPGDLPFIFDRFYQAESRRSGRTKGNGLGLTFCKEALGRMGGSIAVESRLGQGSRFVVTLPSPSSA